MQLIQRHNSLVLQETKTPVTHTDVLRDLIKQEAYYNEMQLRQTFYKTCFAKSPEAKQKAFQRSLDKLVEQGIVTKLISEGETKLARKTEAGPTPPTFRRGDLSGLVGSSGFLLFFLIYEKFIHQIF